MPFKRHAPPHVNRATEICSNCHQRPVWSSPMLGPVGRQKCGFSDWCSECDDALGKTASLRSSAMTANSEVLIRHDPLHYLPPGVWRLVALRTSVAAADRELRLAKQPRDVDDVTTDLHELLGEVTAFGYGPLVATVLKLQMRARSISRKMCAAAIDRCENILAACDRHYYIQPASSRPTYESMAHAVRAADDTWQFQTPAMQHFYRNIIRNRMLVFMEDSDPDDDSDDLEEHAAVCRSPKRACVRPSAASPEQTKPACSNCLIRPVAAVTHCFSDWCEKCDTTLWNSRPV